MQGLVDTDCDRIKGMNADVFTRLKAQAKIQKESIGKNVPLYQILPHDSQKKMGLSLPSNLLKICRKMEEDQDEEDTAMLIRLVKVRHGLWT